jgi:hypothetical protein
LDLEQSMFRGLLCDESKECNNLRNLRAVPQVRARKDGTLGTRTCEVDLWFAAGASNLYHKGKRDDVEVRSYEGLASQNLSYSGPATYLSSNMRVFAEKSMCPLNFDLHPLRQ